MIIFKVLAIVYPSFLEFDTFQNLKSYFQLCYSKLLSTILLMVQVPDIIDNAYVIVDFENGSRGMLDLCMFAEGSKNEQGISVVGDIGKVRFLPFISLTPPTLFHLISI